MRREHMATGMLLNDRAQRLVDKALTAPDVYVVSDRRCAGACIVDWGINVRGGYQAGWLVARVGLADLADGRGVRG